MRQLANCGSWQVARTTSAAEGSCRYKCNVPVMCSTLGFPTLKGISSRCCSGMPLLVIATVYIAYRTSNRPPGLLTVTDSKHAHPMFEIVPCPLTECCCQTWLALRNDSNVTAPTCCWPVLWPRAVDVTLSVKECFSVELATYDGWNYDGSLGPIGPHHDGRACTNPAEPVNQATWQPRASYMQHITASSNKTTASNAEESTLHVL